MDSSIITAFTPPPVKVVQDLLSPFRAYFDPRIYGMEKVEADRPALYVSHHTIYGLTDGFYLGAAMYEEKGIFMRSLGDNMHSMIPVWRKIVEDFGMVSGSREACRALMAAGQHIMVFPGGTREAFKNRGESYQLLWRSRLGFAKMAIENGYDIIPVAAIGGEEMYKIVTDSRDMLSTPFGVVLQKFGFVDKFMKGGDIIPPLATGIGKTFLPRPERLYIMVGDRIETKDLVDKADDEATVKEVRVQAEVSILRMLGELREKRHNDVDEEWWRTLLKMF